MKKETITVLTFVGIILVAVFAMTYFKTGSLATATVCTSGEQRCYAPCSYGINRCYQNCLSGGTWSGLKSCAAPGCAICLTNPPGTTPTTTPATTTPGTTTPPTTPASTTPIQESCTDSDDGDDIYQKGIVTTRSSTYTDSCDTTTRVKEYYCVWDVLGGHMQQKTSICAEGCIDGACVVPTTTPPVTTVPETCTPGQKMCAPSCSLGEGKCYLECQGNGQFGGSHVCTTGTTCNLGCLGPISTTPPGTTPTTTPGGNNTVETCPGENMFVNIYADTFTSGDCKTANTYFIMTIVAVIAIIALVVMKK